MIYVFSRRNAALTALTLIVCSSLSAQPKLPHTGITADQCLKLNGELFVACSSPEAIALSGANKQDGMRTDINAMAYKRVGLFSKTKCVKDSVTGLIWEGKTASGSRAGSNRYTNFGDHRAGDSSAYVAAVNAHGLCGYTDWRLPTVHELHGLVDYGVREPNPKIDASMFPNTAATFYWTSTPNVANPNVGWHVNFYAGGMGQVVNLSESGAVRLVRSSHAASTAP